MTLCNARSSGHPLTSMFPPSEGGMTLPQIPAPNKFAIVQAAAQLIRSVSVSLTGSRELCALLLALHLMRLLFV